MGTHEKYTHYATTRIMTRIILLCILVQLCCSFSIIDADPIPENEPQILDSVSMTNFRNGTIQSENYPNNYDNDAIQWFSIPVKPGDRYVLFRFEELDTFNEQNTQNCGDNVTIYYFWNTTAANSGFDEDNLETFCTNGNGKIFSNGIDATSRITQNLYFKNVTLADSDQEFLRVLFVSDEIGAAKGFKLSYAIYQIPPEPQTDPVSIPLDPPDRTFDSLANSQTGDDPGSNGHIITATLLSFLLISLI